MGGMSNIYDILKRCSGVDGRVLDETNNLKVFENEYGEKYLLKSGLYHSDFNFCSGVLLLVSPALHWGTISIERVIYILEGNGKLISTDLNSGKKLSTLIEEGNSYRVKTGQELMIEKDSNDAVLKIFIHYQTNF